MSFVRKNLNTLVVIAIAVILGGVLILKTMLVKASSVEESLKEEIPQEEKKEKKAEPPIQDEIKYFQVDIKGQVNKPGVYSLEEGKRVVDVIQKASGLTKNADTSTINLSKKISDEMVIIVCSKEEVKANKNEKTKECNCPTIENNAKIQQNTNKENNDLTNTKINPNTASLEELQEIPGIGTTKAQAIIDYRQDKSFDKIEDLLNVNGIGQTIYEKIKDYFILS